MIGDTLDARIATDRHGAPLAVLDCHIGACAMVGEADARRIARLFDQLAELLSDPASRGRTVTLIDHPTDTPTGDSA